MLSSARQVFLERPLYGGALSCSFPGYFLDASDFRPVPDNQEVCESLLTLSI